MVISVKNIKKSYEMGTHLVEALKGVSFSVQSGEFISIMGPSGSGKTTLMNIIGCLDTPSDGIYELNGNIVSKLNDIELANIRNKEIGFIFQSFNLLPKNSTLDNVMLPLKYAGCKKDIAIEKSKKVLDQVGLLDRLDHTPAELSGGQQQRVAIARALVNEPSIIFADEPTGNLDSKTGEDVMRLFKKLNEEGQTIILITHEESIANQSNRIITIMDGLIKSDTGV
tara:strand:- start:3690 stop:4367 length:678 start_codon:yes stop_codon:yes gene_type:complete